MIFEWFRYGLIVLTLIITGSGLCRGVDKASDLSIHSFLRPEYGEVEAKAVIEGSRTEVWRVITDYEHLAQFMPNVKKCRIKERVGNTVRLEYEISFLFHTISYTAEVRESPEKYCQTWRVLDGPFRLNDGDWLLKPAGDDRTELSYHVRISHRIIPDRIILRILIRRIPAVYKAIQERVHLNRNPL